MLGKEKIGDFLVGIGAMTAEQLDEVLRHQAEGDKRIFGEIARELGYVDIQAIDKYLCLSGTLFTAKRYRR